MGNEKLPLVVVERETFEVAKQKTSFETSYYVSNSVLDASSIKTVADELTRAIRFHWGVESNNWIRDVTFDEDRIKTKAGNQVTKHRSWLCCAVLLLS